MEKPKVNRAAYNARAPHVFKPIWHSTEETNAAHWKVEIDGVFYDCIEFDYPVKRS